MPNISSICIDYQLHNSPKLANKDFFFDAKENADGQWLSDPTREFNHFFASLAAQPTLAWGTVSVNWDNGVRDQIPVPKAGALPLLNSIGSLIVHIVALLEKNVENFEVATSNNHPMLQVAERAGVWKSTATVTSSNTAPAP